MVARDERQPLALLLLGAEQHQRLGDADRLVRGEQRRERRVPDAGERERAVVVDLREAEPAVLLGHLHAERAELLEPVEHARRGSSRRARSRAGRPRPRGTRAGAPGTPRPSRPRRRRAAAGARSGRAGSCRGTAPCRSSGSFHSRSRAASATSRACRSVTSVDMLSRVPRVTMTVVTLSAPYGAGGSQVGPPSRSGSTCRSSTARSRPAWPSGSRCRCARRSQRDESVGSWLTRALLSFGQVGPVLAGAAPPPARARDRRRVPRRRPSRSCASTRRARAR